MILISLFSNCCRGTNNNGNNEFIKNDPIAVNNGANNQLIGLSGLLMKKFNNSNGNARRIGMKMFAKISLKMFSGVNNRFNSESNCNKAGMMLRIARIKSNPNVINPGNPPNRKNSLNKNNSSNAMSARTLIASRRRIGIPSNAANNGNPRLSSPNRSNGIRVGNNTKLKSPNRSSGN